MLHFVHRRYKPAVLDAAQFCEVVYRILEWETSKDKSYTPFEEDIKNFGQALSRFESKSDSDDSIRFHIPNTLKTIYVIRNKRGISHVGKINPNLIDATLVVTCADWILAELIRLFHSLQIEIEEAQKIVDNLVTKRIPVVWRVGNTDRRRILTPPGKKLSYQDKVLLLLYDSSPDPVSVKDLLAWTEYSNPSLFRSTLLPSLHKEELIDYEEEDGSVHLSPLGIIYVERELSLDFTLE